MEHRTSEVLLTAIEWQHWRNELNHDWLKNTYMPALGKFTNILDGRVRNDTWITFFLDEILPQWLSRKDDFKHLNSTFEAAMSPRQLLSSERWRNTSEHTCAFLGDLIHVLWSNRLGSAALVLTVDNAIRNADDAYQQLVDALPPRSQWTPTCLRVCHERLFFFRQSCQQLGDAISSFPREVSFT